MGGCNICPIINNDYDQSKNGNKNIQEGERWETLCQMVAKQPIAVGEDDCAVEQQQVDHVEQVLQLFPFLFLFLFLCLYHSVGEEAVQQAAVPNEEEDDDTEVAVVEEQERGSHLPIQN
jgi:hypothetical protein